MSVKRAFKQTLQRMSLLAYSIYLYEGHLKDFRPAKYWRNLQYRVRGAPDNLPIPPARLIWLVIGSTEVAAFFESADAHVNKLMIPLLERNGLSMPKFDSVLDFGCGCGRIIRYWHCLPGVELWGMDYNATLIDWCRQHLDFARFEVNNLEPPLPCQAHKFDFVYARSIFTHLNESLQFDWLREIHRVLKPGGTLLFTVSGDYYQSSLTSEELKRYQAGSPVVRDGNLAGENACAAFHPQSYVYEHWAKHGFDIIDRVPGGEIHYSVQDTYLARKRTPAAK
jgi:SAM-dependent methyltransferase